MTKEQNYIKKDLGKAFYWFNEAAENGDEVHNIIWANVIN